MKHKLVLVLILGLGFISCKKDIAGKCDDLVEAMMNNNQEKSATIMNSWINELPSDEYTEDNINRLISLINDNCTINATLFCFDCVMTLPSQTEIGLEFLEPAREGLELCGVQGGDDFFDLFELGHAL